MSKPIEIRVRKESENPDQDPSETQKIHERYLLDQVINWDRVFFEVDKNFYCKAKPGPPNLGDLRYIHDASEKLKDLPDGYIAYHFHTHENGDHLIHLLDVDLHGTGYAELVRRGVLY